MCIKLIHTIFLLIDTTWWILCLSWHKTMKYKSNYLFVLQTIVMPVQRTTPVPYYSIPMWVWLRQPQRDFPLKLGSLLHHRDRQQHFRTLFGCQTQLNVCKSDAILGIYPMMEMSIPHDHPLRTLFIAPITDSKHVLTSDGQKISAMA